MKGISTFLIILFFYLNAWAERDYTRVEARAERFVQFHEWNSANAMYMLLIIKMSHRSQLCFGKQIFFPWVLQVTLEELCRI